MSGLGGRGGRRAHQRILELGDEDPLSGMANLFDTGMVFSVALMVSLVSAYRLPELLNPRAEVTVVTHPGTPEMEILHRKGVEVEHFRASERFKGGEGERLGTAYRLATGEVVYVPDGEGD